MPDFNSFVYDVSAASPPHIIPSDCYAYFRLSPEYKKDGPPFGFDWIRTGDALDYVAHDVPYKGNVGRNFTETMEVAECDDEVDLDFYPSPVMYDKLCASYAPGFTILFPSRTGNMEIYHTPVVTMYPDNSLDPVKLVLELNITKPPKRIYLNYDEDIFQITGIDSLPCEPGQHKCDIQIVCKRESNKELYIYALSEDDKGEERLAGIIRVWRNDKAFRRIIKVLVLNVKILETDEPDTVVFAGGSELIKASLNQFLPHALIKPEFTEMDCDLGFTPELTSRIIYIEGVANIISYEESYTTPGPDSITPLDIYFKDYVSSLSIDDTQYNVIVVNLGLPQCILQDNGELIVQEGYSYYQYVFLENKMSLCTAVHETLHALGLSHTFNNMHKDNSPTDYTYKPLITDNLMDYSHLCKIRLVQWWEWQWKKARENTLPEE